MSAAWIETERQHDRERWALASERADPDCRICLGKGHTRGYIGPGKYARYECPCTELADWQRAAVEDRVAK